MRRSIALLVTALSCFALAACSDSTPGGGDDCGGATCAAGYVCSNETCVELCASDLDCSAAGTICDGDICIAGARTDIPVINRVDGDGSPDGTQDHTDHHIIRVLTLHGENLDGIAVSLNDGSQSHAATVCEPGSTQVRIELPQGLTPGEYLLSAVSQGGSCNATLQILQGETGAAGVAGPAGPMPSVALGGGMTGDGSSGNPIALSLQATGPLTGAGTTASPLMMPAASASNDGYLTAADYSAFSAKRVINYEVMTGPWLNANASFGTGRGHALTGGMLEFAVGINDWEELLSVPIVPAGTLDTNKRYVVQASFDIVALTADNDIAYGLSDGSRFVGAYRIDNDGGPTIQLGEDTANAVDATTWTVLGNSGNNNTNQRVTRMYFVLDTTTQVVAQLHTSSNSASGVAGTALSRSAELSIVVVANNAAERYGIQLIEVSVAELGM